MKPVERPKPGRTPRRWSGVTAAHSPSSVSRPVGAAVSPRSTRSSRVSVSGVSSARVRQRLLGLVRRHAREEGAAPPRRAAAARGRAPPAGPAPGVTRRAGILAASRPKRAPSAEMPAAQQHEVLRHDLARPPCGRSPGGRWWPGGAGCSRWGSRSRLSVEVGQPARPARGGCARAPPARCPRPREWVTASRQLSAPGQLTTSAGRTGAVQARGPAASQAQVELGDVLGAHPAQQHVLRRG